MGIYSSLSGWLQNQKRSRQARSQHREKAGLGQKPEPGSRLERAALKARQQGRVGQERMPTAEPTPISLPDYLGSEPQQDFPVSTFPGDFFATGEVGTTGRSIIDPSEIGDLLDPGDVSAFIEGEMAIMVDSSNVYSIKYLPKEQQLEVVFKDNNGVPSSGYRIFSISREEASSFAVAGSKGSWYWDFVRVRGSATAHQKPYVRIW
jgi:hypothetical protein